MKFSRKIWYCLFGFLILLNIIVRYPEGPHEVGSDSYTIHAYASSITHYGYATWIIHPYSYVGLTPDSYPSAVPFILSGMSQCTNLNIDVSILMLSFIVGFLGLFGAMLLAKQIKDDDIFIFLIAFLYSTAPIFLRFTIWTTATRHLFMGLFPFFLWGMLRLRSSSEPNWKFIGFNLFIFIMLMSTHRLGILLFLVLIAFIVTILIFRYYKKFEFNTVISKVAPIIWIIVLFSLIFLQINNIGIYQNINISYDYQKGAFLRGNNPFIILSNMVIDYGSRTGILSLFGIIGFGVIFIKRNKSNSNIIKKRNFNEIFIILILLFSSSFILLGLYLTLFLLPIFVLLIVIGIMWSLNYIKRIRCKIISKNRNIVTFLFIFIILVISMFFSSFMIGHWSKPNSISNESPWIEDDTINTAFYFNNYDNDMNYITNSGFLNRKIMAWRNDPISYHIDLSKVPIKKGSIMDLITHDTLYIKQEDSDETFLYIPGRDCDNKHSMDYLIQNKVKFIIEEESVSGKIVLKGSLGLRNSTFLETVHEKRYKLYENNLESIWSV